MNFNDLSLLMRTLPNLKPVQIYGRVYFKLKSKTPKRGDTPPFVFPNNELVFNYKKRTMKKYREFTFLNHTDSIRDAADWNDKRNSALWIYNLHYFDDLISEDYKDRTEEHLRLINEWIAENAVGVGSGWQPYPISLRVVNFIKWNIKTRLLGPSEVESLVLQIRTLEKSLEFHLLGNHLFVNAWSLAVAGMVFGVENPEASRWYRKGMTILEAELNEQVLSDGGHFERSPMYHCLLLDNLLDLISFIKAYDLQVPEVFLNKAREMLSAMKGMLHEDREVSFFNDSAIGIAPAPELIYKMAEKIGLGGKDFLSKQGLIKLPATGLYRMRNSRDYSLIVDGGDIGPRYIFGHAHSDTLSFEMSSPKGRVFVNTGTSEYGTGPRRLLERATLSHNTIRINGQDQSETWSGFRVARQAKALNVNCRESQGKFKFVGEHDGYAHLGVIHQREIILAATSLEINDDVTFNGDTHVEGYFHLHPRFSILKETSKTYLILDELNQEELSFTSLDVDVEVKDYLFAREFGSLVPSKRLYFSSHASDSASFRFFVKLN